MVAVFSKAIVPVVEGFKRLLSELIYHIFITTSCSWCGCSSDSWTCSIRRPLSRIDVGVVAILIPRVLSRLITRLHHSATSCVWCWESRRWSVLLRLVVMLLVTYRHTSLVHFSLRIGSWFARVAILLLTRLVIWINILAENAIIKMLLLRSFGVICLCL